MLRLDPPVMSCCVVLHEVVSYVACAFVPMHVELILVLSVPKPMEFHVERFRMLLLHCIYNKVLGGRIVDLDGCRWLGMSKFFSCGVQDNSILTIYAEGSGFTFCS